MRRAILEKTESILIDTIKDPFGNYFVQDLIDLVSDPERERITAIIIENVIDLGMCKYSSLVLIKLTSQSNKTEFRKLYKKLFENNRLSFRTKNKYMDAFLKSVTAKMISEDQQQASDILVKHPCLKSIRDILKESSQ